MLVLNRKPGERIVIGDCIVIELIEIQKGRVRLGITAPKEMKVWREEIWMEIQQNTQGDNGAPNQPTKP